MRDYEGMAPKRCRCGQVYCGHEWAELPYVGEQNYEGEVLEFRNCSCGSTIAVELEPYTSTASSLSVDN